MAAAEIEIKLSNGAKAGETLKELTKQANTLNKEIKDLKPGTDEFIKKAGDLQKVNTKLTDVKTQIKGTTAASDELKKSWGGILNQIPGFGQLSGVLGKAKGGVGGLTSQFGLLRGAIISTGIGALVILIVGLVSWFAKTEKGANMLSGAFKAFGAVVDTLLNRLWNIKDTLKQLMNDPLAFFKNLGNDIKQAAVEGYELVQVFDDIEDRQRDMAVTAKENEIAVERLLTQQKNVGKTYKERLAILAQVEKLTRDSYAAQLSLSKEYLNAVDREVAAAEKSGTINDELLDKQKDAKLAYLDLVQQEGAIEDKVANAREKLFDKQEIQDNKELANKEKKKKATEDAAQEEIAAAQNIQALKAQLIEDDLQRDIEQINVATDKKIEALKGSEDQITEQKLLLEQIRHEQIAALQDQYAKEEAEKKQADLETELATEQNDLNEKLLRNQISDDMFAEQSAQNVINFQAQRLDLIRQANGEESAEYQKARAEYLASQQAQADMAVAIKKQEMKDQMAAMQGSLSTFGDFFSAIAGMQQQGTKQWKAFATAAAIMSTIQGAINAYTSTAAIPIVGGVLAPIAAGLALVAGYNNVKKIQNTKVETPIKKADGGLVSGPSHEEGGIPGVIKKSRQPVEFEGGEFFFSEKATRAIGVNRLNRVNNYYTRRLATGGPVSPFADRSPVSRSGVSRSSEAISETKPAWVDDLIGAQNARIDRIKVLNVASETQAVNDKVAMIKNQADV